MPFYHVAVAVTLLWYDACLTLGDEVRLVS
jgi:hypothetical protein